MDWEIGATAEAQDQVGDKTTETNALREFLLRPDRAKTWRQWASSLIEDLLVVDAVTLLPRTDRAGRPLALQLIDGTTIKPLVDITGQPPLPPLPAYQQILYGRPETEFTTEELMYRPCNARTWTPYGQSPIEMVAMIVNLSLRRELHYLNWYTAGNIPDSFFIMPETMTDEKLREFQTYFDGMLGGDSEKRSGYVKFLPGPGQYVDTKPGEWKYEFDEYLARVVAWAFGVSPLPIAKMVNRASSEQMDRAHMAGAIEPVRGFLKDIVDEYLHLHCALPWAEFRWVDARPEDQKILLDEDDRLTRIGARTIDEVRVSRGQAPLDGGLGSKPLIITMQGATLLEDALKPPEPTPVVAGSNPPVNEPATGDLTRWRKRALKDAKAAREPRPFVSDEIPPDVQDFIRSGLKRLWEART